MIPLVNRNDRSRRKGGLKGGPLWLGLRTSQLHTSLQVPQFVLRREHQPAKCAPRRRRRGSCASCGRGRPAPVGHEVVVMARQECPDWPTASMKRLLLAVRDPRSAGSRERLPACRADRRGPYPRYRAPVADIGNRPVEQRTQRTDRSSPWCGNTARWTASHRYVRCRRRDFRSIDNSFAKRRVIACLQLGPGVATSSHHAPPPAASVFVTNRVMHETAP